MRLCTKRFPGGLAPREHSPREASTGYDYSGASVTFLISLLDVSTSRWTQSFCQAGGAWCQPPCSSAWGPERRAVAPAPSPQLEVIEPCLFPQAGNAPPRGAAQVSSPSEGPGLALRGQIVPCVGQVADPLTEWPSVAPAEPTAQGADLGQPLSLRPPPPVGCGPPGPAPPALSPSTPAEIKGWTRWGEWPFPAYILSLGLSFPHTSWGGGCWEPGPGQSDLH